MKKIFLLVFVFLYSSLAFSALTKEQRKFWLKTLIMHAYVRLSKLVIHIHDLRVLEWLIVI